MDGRDKAAWLARERLGWRAQKEDEKQKRILAAVARAKKKQEDRAAKTEEQRQKAVAREDAAVDRIWSKLDTDILKAETAKKAALAPLDELEKEEQEANVA